MSKEPKIDYSKLLNLLDDNDLKNISNDLVSQALNKQVNEYTKIDIQLEIPSSIETLLDILSDTIQLDKKIILSKMASQGLNKIIQDTLDSTFESKDQDSLENLQPIEDISAQLKEITETISKFSDLKDMLGSFNIKGK